MLYITGTPIGNLQDITIRQLNILKNVDLIAAEDTRHSRKLLNYYGITTTLTSYHSHSGDSKVKFLIDKLQQGKSIALITDSGMPIISDPGIDIILQCKNYNIPFTTIPGPTAFVSALVMSSFETTKFSFYGFLSQKQKKDLSFILKDEKTIIIYEAPHKLKKTLQLLKDVLELDRKICIARELTKKYEEVLNFNIEEACEYYNNIMPKGEFVIVIQSKKLENEVSKTPLLEQVNAYIKKGNTKKEAIKLVAKDMKLPKNEVYKATLT